MEPQLDSETALELEPYLPEHIRNQINEYNKVSHFYKKYEDMKCLKCQGRLRYLPDSCYGREPFGMYGFNEDINLCCPDCDCLYFPCENCSDFGSYECSAELIYDTDNDEEVDYEWCKENYPEEKNDMREWENFQLCRFVGLDSIYDTDLVTRPNRGKDAVFKYVVWKYCQNPDCDKMLKEDYDNWLKDKVVEPDFSGCEGVTCEVLREYLEGLLKHGDLFWNNPIVPDIPNEVMERFEQGEFDGMFEVNIEFPEDKYPDEFTKQYITHYVGDQDLYYIDEHIYDKKTGPDGGFGCWWRCPRCHNMKCLSDK